MSCWHVGCTPLISLCAAAHLSAPPFCPPCPLPHTHPHPPTCASVARMLSRRFLLASSTVLMKLSTSGLAGWGQTTHTVGDNQSVKQPGGQPVNDSVARSSQQVALACRQQQQLVKRMAQSRLCGVCYYIMPSTCIEASNVCALQSVDGIKDGIVSTHAGANTRHNAGSTTMITRVSPVLPPASHHGHC